MNALTLRQREALSFLEQSHAHSGMMPSTRELAAHFGFASQTAAVHLLRSLERKGYVQRRAKKARAIALVADQGREPTVNVPVYGSIAAGYAEQSEQESIGTVTIDSATSGLRQGHTSFALRVRGDSMNGAAIHEGDLALLEAREPRNGDIVAALIDGETTLKRFVTNRGRPHLKAENPRFPDLIPASELVIQGVLVALVRRYRL